MKFLGHVAFVARLAPLFGALLAEGCAPSAGDLGATSGPDVSAKEGQTASEKNSLEADGGAAAAKKEDACLLPERGERREEVCRRWSCARRSDPASAWVGNAATCSGGSIDDATRAQALELVNTYRYLADLPPVAADPSWDPAAQACALVTHANGFLTHELPASSPCWSDVASRAAHASLIANRAAPEAVGGFVSDPGNESTMVHRRWLLWDKLKRVGFGSTNRYACILVDGRGIVPDPPPTTTGGSPTLGGSVDAGQRDWVSWPPAGPVPFDAITADKLDTMGWTVQSSTLDLAGARVEVRIDGAPAAVHVTPLVAGQGSLSAVRFTPDGWSTEPGRRYDVEVTRGTVNIAFTVEPVGCP